MTVRDAFDSVGEKKSREIYDSAPQGHRNYDLAGPESRAAIRKGLASGQWFVPRIERKTLRRLMQGSDDEDESEAELIE